MGRKVNCCFVFGLRIIHRSRRDFLSKASLVETEADSGDSGGKKLVQLCQPFRPLLEII